MRFSFPAIKAFQSDVAKSVVSFRNPKWIFPDIKLQQTGRLHIHKNSNIRRKSEKNCNADPGSTQCLKIVEKVTCNIASEASYVYILSRQKFIKNAKNCQFWRVFEN